MEGSKPRTNNSDELKAKTISKSKQKEREDALKREAERSRLPMTAEERLEEQMRLRRLQEESDAELTAELYGKANLVSTKNETGKTSKAMSGVYDFASLSEFLDEMDLSTGAKASELARTVSKRLNNSKITTASIVMFLKEISRTATTGLNDEQVNEVISVLTVIKNDKIKAKVKKPIGKVEKPKLNDTDKYDRDLDLELARGVGGKPGGRKFDPDEDFM